MFNGGHHSNWTHRALNPGWWKSCFDFGGAIVQFSISGSIYQSFLNPPSWAAQLTIITMRIKVIVICCIWNLFLKKNKDWHWKECSWKVFVWRKLKCLTIQNEEKKRWKMRKDGFLKMRKMEFSKWGREMEDGIELPLFQVIDQTGRMAASSRWVIQFHYFLILSLSNHRFWPHYIQSICSIYWPSNCSDMGSPSNSSESSWRAGATTESKRWPIRTFLIFLNISQ